MLFRSKMEVWSSNVQSVKVKNVHEVHSKGKGNGNDRKTHKYGECTSWSWFTMCVLGNYTLTTVVVGSPGRFLYPSPLYCSSCFLIIAVLWAFSADIVVYCGAEWWGYSLVRLLLAKLGNLRSWAMLEEMVKMPERHEVEDVGNVNNCVLIRT